MSDETDVPRLCLNYYVGALRLVAVLAGTLILLGLSALFLAPELGGISGWLGAAVFLLFAVLLFGAQDDVRAIIQ
ncbi:hypothetical protein [Cryobacterium sp. Y62]|uniref:hypothetical protein n=1 Tax=Cryobacterium sp. Y62 TaxID=2048284 RepID=UPI0011B04F44|nr:hypothetical protein [Cryobacterium sp. Y62]